ncbi:hypothetical protein AB0O31_00825 [Kitasatospora cineracea]|uniref:hypothetical protein n=1 Tax=Kitasatospora cineracea TaxID=88074 RepID=UPI0034478F43
MNKAVLAPIGYAVAIAGGLLAYLAWDGAPVLAGTAALLALAVAGAALGVQLSGPLARAGAAGRGESGHGESSGPQG